jgi:hypothetical protein
MNLIKTFVLGWMFALVGCSSAPEEGGVAPIPMDQFSERAASALCEALAPCCAAAELSHTSATCESNATLQLDALLATGNSLPNLEYDAQAAGDCLNQMKTAYASCQNAVVPPVGACRRIFVGKLPIGAECKRLAVGNECAEGYCDYRADDTTVTSVCVRYEAPSSESSYCEYPNGPTNEPECQPKKPEGAACSGDWECVEGNCNEGTCRPEPAASKTSCSGVSFDIEDEGSSSAPRL